MGDSSVRVAVNFALEDEAKSIANVSVALSWPVHTENDEVRLLGGQGDFANESGK